MSEIRNDQSSQPQKPKTRRGFASMDPAKQREIASKGGKAAHQQGVAHRWSREEARVAGRKGGEAVSRNKEHMAEIGRRGGEASHRRSEQPENQARQNPGDSDVNFSRNEDDNT